MIKGVKRRIITRWLKYTIMIGASARIHDKLMKVMTKQMSLGCIVTSKPTVVKQYVTGRRTPLRRPATEYTITNPEYCNGTQDR